MNKHEAQAIAIELAKIALANIGGNSTVYPSKSSANDVADFIETLTDRLTTN